MNELHLFAGAGGGILGGILLGHTCVCAVEIEPYCREVLLQRQRDGILPKFPIWDDVKTFDGRPWRGLVDVVCGGFPCQDISAAGKGKGIRGGERSGLWSEFARIIGEVQPSYVFVENSPMLTLRGLDIVLGDLASLGYDARWGVFSAADVGAQHIRGRCWILADPKKAITRQENFIQKNIQGQFRGVVWHPLSSPDWKFMRPEPRRMVDGMADWSHRLAAIGNGQVPAVVRLAWNTLAG